MIKFFRDNICFKNINVHPYYSNMKFYPNSKLMKFVSSSSEEKYKILQNQNKKKNKEKKLIQIEKINNLPYKYSQYLSTYVIDSLMTPPYHHEPKKYIKDMVMKKNTQENIVPEPYPYGEEYQLWYDRTFFPNEIEYLIHQDNLEREYYDKLEIEFYENFDKIDDDLE